jgi:hypothetical protein
MRQPLNIALVCALVADELGVVLIGLRCGANEIDFAPFSCASNAPCCAGSDAPTFALLRCLRCCALLRFGAFAPRITRSFAALARFCAN